MRGRENPAIVLPSLPVGRGLGVKGRQAALHARYRRQAKSAHRGGCRLREVIAIAMSKIARVEIFQVDLAPKAVRSDAIQAFTKQETPIVRIWTDDGADGTGYSYTIGTGGSAVVALLRDNMAPWLLGRDPAMVEEIWKGLFFHTHANAVGATVSLALAAIDMALWDLRCKRAGAPLHVVAGGAQTRVPIYDTEGGWLNFTPQELVDRAMAAREKGFRGVKIKVGRPHVAEDVARLAAVRRALGPEFELMVDANQCFTVSEAIRRARHYEEFDLAWFEEPLPAEDVRRACPPVAIHLAADRNWRVAVSPGPFPRIPANSMPARSSRSMSPGSAELRHG